MTPRRMAIVGALAAGAAAVVMFGPGVGLPTETGQRPSNQAGGGAQTLPDVPVIDLKLERLQGERDVLPEATRNPFRFRQPAAPPPAAAAPTGMRTPPRAEDVPPPVAAGPAPPPPIPVKFFGLLVLRGERVATFSDARGNTFFGKEGDIIEGRYRVLRIGTDSVELAYLDGRGRQTIRLTGQ